VWPDKYSRGTGSVAIAQIIPGGSDAGTSHESRYGVVVGFWRPPSHMQVLPAEDFPFFPQPDMEFTQREVMEHSKFTP